MNTNFSWEYDNYSGHYIIRGARVLFPNFAGAAQNYNTEGRRNFRVEISEDMANEMRDRGIFVKEYDGREDSDETQRTIKVSVYPDADIRFLSGRNMTSVVIDNENKDNDMGRMIDTEFRKGHVMNGEIDLEFRIARNTKVSGSSPYLRVEMMVIPIRKSKLAEAYEHYMDDEDDDVLPM